MQKTIITTDRAPKAIGPYEQGIKAGNFLFTSGQIPLDPSTNEPVTGDISLQTERVIKNIKEVLEAGGSSLNDVIKTTIFLNNIADFNAVNSVYERYFSENRPARSCVEVSALPRGVGIEMEVVALAK